MAFPEGYLLLHELKKHLPILKKIEKQNTLMQRPKIKKRKVAKNQTNQEG